jgi:hypothetical protein
MKQLILGDTAMPIFFHKKASIEDVCGWINRHMDRLDLNEPESCVANVEIDDESIIIYRDEDSVEAFLQEITPENI